jgi:hypothetical protein
MRRSIGLGLTALLLAGSAAPAAEGDLAGTWQVDHDGYNEIWTIKNEKGDWSLSGVVMAKGKEVGSFRGANLKVADGKATCTQKWAKKPDPTWSDDVALTAEAKGDRLAFTWDAGGGNSGTREMKRVKAASADGAELAGVWQVDHDGYKEVWSIETQKGQWAVSGVFMQKGKQVGAWVGADPKYADGKLTCVQKWVKKPVATWNDDVNLTASLSGEKLNFIWDAGNGNSGSRDMTKAK